MIFLWLLNAKRCNCQQKENCLMNGDCLKEILVYYATISCNDKNYKPRLYKGSCETRFKKRYKQIVVNVNVVNQSKMSLVKRNLLIKITSAQDAFSCSKLTSETGQGGANHAKH